MKNETIAVIGYGVQGPGQSLNLRDNGFNVIVGQRQGKTYEKAVADGWVPGETLFSIEEACKRATIIQVLLSDAAQIACWPTIKQYLTPGKALYFSHGFAITYKERTGIVPPADVDVIMVAPKGSGTSLRTMFLEGRGLNSSYAIFQDATGRAFERVIALGIGVGSGYSLDDENVKSYIRSEVLRDKKAEMLMAQVNGVKDMAGAKAKGGKISTVNQVTFAAPVFVQTTGMSEPALSGAVSATAKGKFCSQAVKGFGGVYLFQVTDKKTRSVKYNEKEYEQRQRQRIMQYAGNFMQELYFKADVKDNRYMFF